MAGKKSQERKVSFTGAYIQLNQLLKRENMVQSGGEAKAAIEAGQVLVNGKTAEAVRKKLYDGDTVQRGDCCLILSASKE